MTTTATRHDAHGPPLTHRSTLVCLCWVVQEHGSSRQGFPSCVHHRHQSPERSGLRWTLLQIFTYRSGHVPGHHGDLRHVGRSVGGVELGCHLHHWTGCQCTLRCDACVRVWLCGVLVAQLACLSLSVLSLCAVYTRHYCFWRDHGFHRLAGIGGRTPREQRHPQHGACAARAQHQP